MQVSGLCCQGLPVRSWTRRFGSGTGAIPWLLQPHRAAGTAEGGQSAVGGAWGELSVLAWRQRNPSCTKGSLQGNAEVTGVS